MALQQPHFDDGHTDHQTQESITLDLSSALYTRLKRAAENQQQTINEYIGSFLEHAVPEDKDAHSTFNTKYPYSNETPDLLNQIYHVREQVKRDSKGHIFENSTETVRQQREERAQYIEESQKLSWEM